jgi:hypothetical protein
LLFTCGWEKKLCCQSLYSLLNRRRRTNSKQSNHKCNVS